VPSAAAMDAFRLSVWPTIGIEATTSQRWATR